MPPIPAAVSAYGPALLALAAALAAAVLCRAKTRQAWLRPGLALACLVGWAAMEPLGQFRSVALAPLGPGPAALLVPTAAILLVEIGRTIRRGRNDRALSVLAAAVVGWWLARTAAGPGEFWRIAILTALLAVVVGLVVRRRPERALALALASWAAAAAAGFSLVWTVAAAVLAASALAPVAFRLAAPVPSAAAAALLAAAELARGRLPYGRIATADLACLLPLLAPLLLLLLEQRLGKRWRPLAPALAAALIGAAIWLLRRTASL